MNYLFFQVYKNMEESRQYVGKSLPVVLKNFISKKQKSIVVYVGQFFGIFPLLEFIQLYAKCTSEVRQLLDPISAQV